MENTALNKRFDKRRKKKIFFKDFKVPFPFHTISLKIITAMNKKKAYKKPKALRYKEKWYCRNPIRWACDVIEGGFSRGRHSFPPMLPNWAWASRIAPEKHPVLHISPNSSRLNPDCLIFFVCIFFNMVSKHLVYLNLMRFFSYLWLKVEEIFWSCNDELTLS